MDDLGGGRLETSGRDVLKPARPQVVIIGAGFAELNAAKALARTAVNVTIIDRRKYHLFQPALSVRDCCAATIIRIENAPPYVDLEYQPMHPCFGIGQDCSL